MTESKIWQFVKGSFILVFSNVILKAIHFFLLPMYTKYLTPEELGISDNITNLVSFLFPLFVMAFDAAFGAFYYQDNKEEQKQKVYATTSLFFRATSMVAVIMIFFSPMISRLLFKREEYAMAIGISLFSLAINLWYLSDSLSIRMENRMALFSLINIVASLFTICLNIVFVAILKYGYIALITSNFIVQLIQFFLYRITNKTKVYIKNFDKTLWKKMFRYAYPMAPVVVANWVLNLSDRYLLLYYNKNVEIGLYGVASRFQGVLMVITSAVYTAYTSFAFSTVQDHNAKEGYIKVFDVIYILLSLICINVSLFSKEIVYSMTEESYYMAYKLIGPLLFGQICYAMNTIVGYGFAHGNKTEYFFIPVFFASVTNVILNIIFIPKYGAQAAAATTLCGYFIMMFLTHYLSQKVYSCSYHMKPFYFSFILTFFTYLLVRDSDMGNKIIAAIINNFFIIFIYRNQLKEIRNFLTYKIKSRKLG